MVLRGRCLSVGLEIALAADIRLADPTARLGLPDLSVGRLPSWGGTQRLPRAVGAPRAAAMVLLGDVLAADEARSAGLLAGVSAPGGLDELVEATFEQLLATAPLAQELAKEAVHRGAELPLRDGLRLEGDLNHLLQAPPTGPRASRRSSPSARPTSPVAERWPGRCSTGSGSTWRPPPVWRSSWPPPACRGWGPGSADRIRRAASRPPSHGGPSPTPPPG